MSEHVPDILAPLIGARWERGGAGPDAWDCWHFAAHLQRALFGRDLPLAPALEIDTADHRAVIAAIRTSPLQREWLPVPERAHGDLVLMRRHGGASHYCVWLDADGVSGIAHCARPAGVMLQSCAQLMTQYRTLEYRRPAAALLNGVSTAVLPAPGASGLTPEDALAVIVTRPEQPLAGAKFAPVAAGASPMQVLRDLEAELDGPVWAHWLIHSDEPLLVEHPETGIDEWVGRRLAPGDVLWIAPIPPGGGDGGSQIFAAVAAIALAFAAPYLVAGLGVAALGTSAASLTLAGNVLAAGITLGGQLLISALVTPAAPSNPDAIDGPSPTYTLTPPGNRTRPGGQIPWLWGTLRRQPDLLAAPNGEFRDNEQDFYCQSRSKKGPFRGARLGHRRLRENAPGMPGAFSLWSFKRVHSFRRARL